MKILSSRICKTPLIIRYNIKCRIFCGIFNYHNLKNIQLYLNEENLIVNHSFHFLYPVKKSEYEGFKK